MEADLEQLVREYDEPGKKGKKGKMEYKSQQRRKKARGRLSETSCRNSATRTLEKEGNNMDGSHVEVG